MIFAGIGSRSVTKNEEVIIKAISKKLFRYGFALRSGGANGSDELFESEFPYNKEIYLPWKNFNNNSSELYDLNNINEAEEIAKKFHPVWNNLSIAAKKLHTRNVYQILGQYLNNPCEFVICCADEDNGVQGGTGQAVRIALAHDIPVYNIRRNTDEIKSLIKVLFKRYICQRIRQIYLFESGRIKPSDDAVLEELSDINYKDLTDEQRDIMIYVCKKYPDKLSGIFTSDISCISDVF